MRCALRCASLWVAMQTNYSEGSVWPRVLRVFVTAPLKPGPGSNGPPAASSEGIQAVVRIGKADNRLSEGFRFGCHDPNLQEISYCLYIGSALFLGGIAAASWLLRHDRSSVQ